MDDDALLAQILRRFIHDPDRHPAEEPYLAVQYGYLRIDGGMPVTDDEAAALERAAHTVIDVH